MYMIQIEEGKMDKLSEHIEKSLKHMGKAMQFVDECMDEGGMGRREGSSYSVGRYGGSMGNRYPVYGGYGMGYKDDEDWEDEEMAERRGRRRDSRGRYI